MVIFHQAQQLRHHLDTLQKPIGFVPTMGALHAGHQSLLAHASVDGNYTVVSIFVNPTQFNDPKDFEKYPITTSADLKMLAESRCDAVYMPSVADVYPNGKDQAPTYSFGFLETVFEGAQRPGHFRGVGQVVARLLDIVQPHHLYLGQKDYQQCRVIADLIRQMEMSVDLHMCPTVREADGLAMSSRNRRLTPAQRSQAGTIYQCLVSIKTKCGKTPFEVVRKECHDILVHKGFEVEYIALADADTLEPLPDFNSERPMVALIAARLGTTRLIDNMALS